jgi:2-polyprenyl-6-methoxyphenol hydroxylase-like FAD-dependent oxidoreductase
MALAKAGCDPVIFEAYERSAGLNHGAYLTVAVNGLDALRAIEADGVVRSAGFRSEKIDFRSGTGRRLGTIAMGPTMPDGTGTYTLKRADLYTGLYRAALDRGVPIEHDKRLVGARQLPGGGVVAFFADGTQAEGDLLIGADGIHSAVRAAIDPAAPAPRYTGLGNTGGFTRAADVAPDSGDYPPGDYVMIWGRNCFFGYTVSPDGEIWWFANPSSPTEIPRQRLRELDTGELRAQLVSLLSPDRTPGAAIVHATTEEFRLFNQYDLPTVPTWSAGSMVIIGDAAHAVSPASGQGASLAAEDAVVLARCLRDLPDIPSALARYEQLRRDRVERIVRWGAGMNATKKSGLVARLQRDLLLPFILRKADDPARVAALSWIFEHHIDWSTDTGPDGVPR